MMSFFEMNYVANRENGKLASWVKAEKLYNCDDFFASFRRKKNTKKNK